MHVPLTVGDFLQRADAVYPHRRDAVRLGVEVGYQPVA